MIGVINYVKDNWLELAAILSGVINVFSLVAALTTTKKDDKIAAWLKSVVAKFLSLK